MAEPGQQGQTVREEDSIDELESTDNVQQKKTISPSPAISSWEKIAGFIFGIAFITALLSITVLIPDPTPTQYATFKTILALAAAGVGGILAGSLHVQGSIQKWSIRAGGAFALFVLVYFFAPAPPETSPDVTQTIEEGGTGVIHSGTGDVNVNQPE